MGNIDADVAQLVERELPKLEVAGSRPVVRFVLGIAGQIAVTMVLAAASAAAASADAPPAAGELAPNTVALVSEMPVGKGTISTAEFGHELELTAAVAHRPVPKPGASGYAKLKRLAVDSLLEAAWLRGQAVEWGISVSRHEVKREIARIKRENFESAAEYREFLREAHYTRRDVYERVELQLLSARLQRRLTKLVSGYAKTRAEEQRAIGRWLEEFNARWRERTVCASGYETERCSNGPTVV